LTPVLWKVEEMRRMKKIKEHERVEEKNRRDQNQVR
jgi:hypothetical protein